MTKRYTLNTDSPDRWYYLRLFLELSVPACAVVAWVWR